MSRRDEFENFVEGAIGNTEVARLTNLYRQTGKRTYRARVIALVHELRGSKTACAAGSH